MSEKIRGIEIVPGLEIDVRCYDTGFPFIELSRGYFVFHSKNVVTADFHFFAFSEYTDAIKSFFVETAISLFHWKACR